MTTPQATYHSVFEHASPPPFLQPHHFNLAVHLSSQYQFAPHLSNVAPSSLKC